MAWFDGHRADLAMSVAVFVLATASFARAGSGQPLSPWGDDCLVNHLARVALDAGAAPVLRVLGANALAIAARRPPPGVYDVLDPTWARGAGGLIASGLRAALLSTPALLGAAILNVDAPPISPPLSLELA